MSNRLDILRDAWTGVITHKLRSFLTILGIVIGVGAVIALMSIGKGATADILSRIESLGSDLITIQPGSSVGFGGIRGGSSVMTLTEDDAEAIAAEIEGVDTVSPLYSSNQQLVFESENTSASVIGTNTEYADIYNLEFSSGTFFSQLDYERATGVAVIGSEVSETLFGEDDPIGQPLRMGSRILRVVGVMESSGGIFSSTDRSVMIPLSTMQYMFAHPKTTSGDNIVSSIALSLVNEETSEEVSAEITTLLRGRHELASSDEDDFSITSMEELVNTISEATGTMTLLLGAIAAISLLVGGIGVMNIMLVSVLERTREIGIRKALGARERDIWGQFLAEAILLTLTGGIIGVAGGWGVAYIVASTGVVSTIVSADIVILAVSVSVGIGLFFGFYPAWDASRLNPIEALRSE